MSKETKELSVQERRKKRVNLYKRIIIILIVSVIILPTVLCIVLFLRMNSMQKELKYLRSVAERQEDQVNTADNEYPDETPGISDKNDNHNVAGSGQTLEQTSEQTTASDIRPPDDVTQPEDTVVTEPATDETVTEPESSAPEPLAPDLPAPSGQKELVDKALAEGRKVVYLTFDDGPCNNTGNLLNLLDRYGVKATFFVNCHPGYEEYLRRIVAEGHTLAMHTYSHEYAHVYQNIDTFSEEIVSLRDYLYDTTGTTPYIFRFPGGSSNTKAQLPISYYIDYLNKNNLVYFDWNVSSGDGSEGLTADQVYNNVINGINKQTVSVVLMHDAEYKLSTYEAMSRIIETLQAMNALILPITYDTVPVHHNV